MVRFFMNQTLFLINRNDQSNARINCPIWSDVRAHLSGENQHDFVSEQKRFVCNQAQDKTFEHMLSRFDFFCYLIHAFNYFFILFLFCQSKLDQIDTPKLQCNHLKCERNKKPFQSCHL